LGLIWAGQAAAEISGGRIRPGVHQVVNPEEWGTPRMSIWAELCTSAQSFTNPENLSWNSNNTKIIVTNLMDYGPENPFIVPVQNGDIATALKHAEQ
jgi:hypothetical protein